MTKSESQEMTKEFEAIKKFIHIKGANANNLKNIEIKIPKNKLIVVTGLSGSGKSSLIMDTLYAEGQRRYVESLSSYARQFMSRMKKPQVDFIKGISPAIAIEQKVSNSNARSTVGSLTEIYDYLRLLFARVGITISPISGKEVKRHTITDVVSYLLAQEVGTKIQLFFPIPNVYQDRSLLKQLEYLIQKGYSRIQYKKEIIHIEDFIESKNKELKKTLNELKSTYYVLVDRFVVNDDEENQKRIADSVQTAFYEGSGECLLQNLNGKSKSFNNRFELDGMTFLEPSHQLFNYNNPFGACPKCEGYGQILGIDPKKVIPNEELSVYDSGIACWTGEKSKWYKEMFILNGSKIDFPIHRPIKDLTPTEYELLWEGNEDIDGINHYFQELSEKSYKIQNRIIMARFRGRTKCYNCKGGRLRKEAQYVFVGGKTLTELVHLPIIELQVFFKKIKLTKYQKQIASRILIEINNRIDTMNDVGLSYLHLNRVSSTLSGGETQRINLTRTLGSNLTNALYILDEPSIGLHPKDTANMVKVLKNLRDMGNTVIVVEHEEEVIRKSDYIIDVGPKAGSHGGEIVFEGSYASFIKKADTLTAKYLRGEMEIELPDVRRRFYQKIGLTGMRQHNLKNIDITFPLNAFTVITGVSGSGKSTLVKHILYPALSAHLQQATNKSIGKYNTIEGDINSIDIVEFINQNPIGKSSRSNPVTYVKAFDSIRRLFSRQQASFIKGFEPKHFSFNTEGGRCEACKGDGHITVEMQFLADVRLVCDDCKGRKFKEEVLDVRYHDKNIFDVLSMTVDDALMFFQDIRDVHAKLKPLSDVGLGYVQLGQASSTLSGGEAQRVKLASFLGKDKYAEKILFIFDEPTTGLHFHDIEQLLKALNALVDKGHTVMVVEHNLDVIKTADWIIDLGPVGGEEGGHLVYQGELEGITKESKSYTGQYLSTKL